MNVKDVNLYGFTPDYNYAMQTGNKLFKKLLLLSIFLFLLFNAKLFSQTTYTTAGTFSYTVPAGVYQIKVECWGAGGGGGGNGTNKDGAGGGGGGAYSRSILSVTPGNTITLYVGTGGASGTGTVAGGTGEDTWFGSNTTVMAKGGSGGSAPVSGAGGLAGNGGIKTNGAGTYKYSGGDGGTGINNNNGYGGPGGSSAGYSSNGSSGATSWSTVTAGTPPTGGGIGGNGGAPNNAGAAGTIPGGGGGGSGENSTGGKGANGQVMVTIPSSILLSASSQTTDANVYQGTNNYVLYNFSTQVSVSNAQFNAVTFTTAGSYAAADVSQFQLYYSTTNDISTATLLGSITTSLGTGSHSFSGLTQSIPSGTTGNFWITTDIKTSATVGNTINVNAIANTDLTFENANVTGTGGLGGTQTIQAIPRISFASSNPSVAAASVNQGAVDQQIYKFSTAITLAEATLTAVSFTTTGTCTAADIRKYKLWYSTTNDISTANQVGSDIISGLAAGTHTFSGLNISTPSGSTGYFWITMDIAAFPTNGRTLSVNALTSSNLTYERGVISGTAYAGGTQTISVLSGILLTSEHPAVSANSILQGTLKQKVYKFSTIITGAAAVINSVSFTTTGTYAATDISNFKLWYNTTNSLVSATQLGTTLTSSLGTGTHTISGLNQSTAAGATAYFWITIDVSTTAGAGNTLTVSAITTSNLTFASGSKYGSTYTGGIQTIQQNVDHDGDGVADIYDWDDDNDGITDVVENNPCNTSTKELFPNSDFSAGNTGFSSAYNYMTGSSTALWDEGTYTVTTNPLDVHPYFYSCGDHTTGTGNMMVINGDPTANKTIWSSGSIAVTPNTDYTLSLYVASVTTGNPAQLIWNVNGENIGAQFNATSTNGQWVNAVAIWNSGSNTVATFDIVNLNLIASGNDFAMDDISCTYRTNCDADGDGVQDRLDLDSDNDGIFDVLEAGGTDANNDGIIDSFTDTDKDGLSDAVDNQDAGSGTGEIITGTALTNPDTDADGQVNRIDIDSDGDGCLDAIEAGFTDGDGDGKLGTSPVTVNTMGKVTSATGYTAPANADGNSTKDYVQKVPYITTQPADINICLTSTTVAAFSIVAVNSGGTYQWQVSTDGGTSWTNISGATASTLNLTGITASLDNNKYRVLLYHAAYKCSPLISNAATLRAFSSKPAQPGTISGNTTVCPAVTSAYSIAAVSQATSYTWTVPSGWTLSSGNGSTSISAISASSGSGNITVAAVNTCGTGTVSTLGVTINTPSPGFSTPSTTSVCQSVDVVYTTETGKSNYIWNVTTGSVGADYSIVSGGSTTDNSYTIKWITTGSKTVSVSYTSGGCSGSNTKTITVNANAIITSQPVSPAAICAGAGTASFSVTVSGTVSNYQWQGSADGITWSNLSNTAPYSGAATNTLTLTNPAFSLNNYQYRCLVTGVCGIITSNAATLNLNTIAISSQSTATQTQCINGTFTAISVTATGAGTLTYQWYSNGSASNSGGTAITGATAATYTPLATTAGTKYYYCIVTGTCGTATSAVSGAFVVNVATAISSQSTATQTQCINGTFTAISVTATGAGTLTYQWYSNGSASNSGGTAITGATAATYTPLATTAGTKYYYCIVTGTCGTATSAVSGAFVVNVATVITSESMAGQTQCIGNTFSAITVTATGTGSLTYQWYVNTASSTSGGTAISGAVNANFTPLTTTIGTKYYYCIVTGSCGSATSSVSGSFIVNPLPSPGNMYRNPNF